MYFDSFMQITISKWNENIEQNCCTRIRLLEVSAIPVKTLPN